MTQLVNEQTRYIRSRILEEILEDPTEQVYSFKSFDVDGRAITVFNWVIVSTMVLLLACILHKRSRPNEVDDANTDADRSPEEEEEMRKNTIFKLYHSEHIQQKITSDQIRLDRDISRRTIDTCDGSSEEFQSGGDNLSSDGEYSYDEEEDHGTVVIAPFPRVSSKPASETSLESSNDNENDVTTGSNSSNDDKNEKTVSNLCAICLEEYHEGDTIVWSSNKNCRHAFHRDCLTNYLVKVKEQETYPCPICRQNFFFDNDEDKTCEVCEEV